MKTASCRTCGEPIIWTQTNSGKRMPVDAEPNSEGTFSLREEDDLVLATYVRAGSDPELHTSHFATCPQSNAWRKG